MTGKFFVAIVISAIFIITFLIISAILSRRKHKAHMYFAISSYVLTMLTVPIVEILRPKGFQPPHFFGLHLILAIITVLTFTIVIISGIKKYAKKAFDLKTLHNRLIPLFLILFFLTLLSGILLFLPFLW